MKKFLPFIFVIIITTVIVCWFSFLLLKSNIQLLNPKGLIAQQQSELILLAMGIMLAIAIPVVLIGLLVGWKYRSGTNKPNLSHDPKASKLIIFTYWAFLTELVLVFFFIVWTSSHRLDPHKPIVSEESPITIQVVALRWKWLFIYPEENIATVNFLQIPVNTPINFRLTSDGPMNSFWIPQLGGQIYSMASMETKIHLMASEEGDYRGEAAEINGDGFSGMRFTARASSRVEFDDWVEEARNSANPLTHNVYEKLAQPSEREPVVFYSNVEEDLFNTIIMKYMPGRNNAGFEARAMEDTHY